MYLSVESINIHYLDHGEGTVVVLLHGFLLSASSLEGLAEVLSQNFRVISIDLPGHGKSDDLDTEISIDKMALIVKELLSKLGISKANMVGHSMGGYVSLSFLEKYPRTIDKIILLNSKAKDDNSEAKVKRDLSIEMLKKHPSLFIKESIKNLFWSDNIEQFSNSIDEIVVEAKKGSYTGYIGALTAMKNRPDRSHLLKQRSNLLYIAAKYDPVIPYSLSKSEIDQIGNGDFEILANSGHMGFIEEKRKCEKIINDYLLLKYH